LKSACLILFGEALFWKQGSQIQSTKSQTGGCSTTFPSLEPTHSIRMIPDVTFLLVHDQPWVLARWAAGKKEPSFVHTSDESPVVSSLCAWFVPGRNQSESYKIKNLSPDVSWSFYRMRNYILVSSTKLEPWPPTRLPRHSCSGTEHAVSSALFPACANTVHTQSTARNMACRIQAIRGKLHETSGLDPSPKILRCAKQLQPCMHMGTLILSYMIIYNWY